MPHLLQLHHPDRFLCGCLAVVLFNHSLLFSLPSPSLPFPSMFFLRRYLQCRSTGGFSWDTGCRRGQVSWDRAKNIGACKLADFQLQEEGELSFFFNFILFLRGEEMVSVPGYRIDFQWDLGPCLGYVCVGSGCWAGICSWTAVFPEFPTILLLSSSLWKPLKRSHSQHTPPSMQLNNFFHCPMAEFKFWRRIAWISALLLPWVFLKSCSSRGPHARLELNPR